MSNPANHEMYVTQANKIIEIKEKKPIMAYFTAKKWCPFGE